MNAIDALIQKGHVDALISAAKPGETYYAGQRGEQSSDGSFPKEMRAILNDFQAAAPAGTRAMLWISKSTDGKRSMGEISIDKGKDTPMLVWAIGDGTNAKLDYGSQRQVAFTSASERLEASARPISVLEMVDHPHRDDAIEMVEALKYEPKLNLGGDLRLSFRQVDLVSAHV